MLNDLRSRHLLGRTGGQVAVCTAHPLVLAAAADGAKRDGALLLVEATANQVNLSGGYTGMTPADFADHMTRLAADRGLAPEQILLGADHLGPHLWRQLPAMEAMTHAEALARAFVAAGYGKLHLDTGRACADDPRGRLPVNAGGAAGRCPVPGRRIHRRSFPKATATICDRNRGAGTGWGPGAGRCHDRYRSSGSEGRTGAL